MLTINQTLYETEEDLLSLEKNNHKEAFEYLPYSREKSYIELAKNENVIFLSIKVTANNGEKEEEALINSQTYMALLACSNRILSKNKDLFELVSISYPANLNKLKSEGLFINALLIPESQEKLSPSDIKRLEKEISIELKFIKKPAENKVSPSEETSNNQTSNNEISKVEDKSEKIEPKLEKTTYANIDNLDESLSNKSVIAINEPTEKFNNDEQKTDECIIIKEDKKTEIPTELPTENQNNQNNQNNKDAINEPNSNESKDIPDSVEAELLAEEEALRKEFERKRKELAARKKAEAERLEKERLEKERLEKERLEKERLEKERLEKERLEKERLEKERLEAERLEKERLEAEQLEKERIASVEEKLNKITYTDSNEEDLMNFIKSFAPIPSAVEEREIEEQQKAYENATEEVPFLNSIDRYIPSYDITKLEDAAPIYEIHEEDEFIQTTASKNKLRSAFIKVISFFMDSERISLKRVLTGDTDMDIFMEDIKIYIEKNLQIPIEDMPMFLDKIKRALFSYHVLIPAINDPKVTDIKVLAPDNINVKVDGKHYTASDLAFINTADYIRFIEMLIIKNRISLGSDVLLFTDKDFNPDYRLRFNISLPSINSTGLPYIHIRKVPKEKTTIKDLIKADMMDEKVACYILDKIVNARGIVFSGPSASGKTTMQNACIDYIPKDKTILCIQESEEMYSNIHPAAYFQHIKKDSRGNILVGLSELGQNGLVCDAGYFIIGECKGAEVRDLLRASNTGHKCWCTVHSQSSTETITRLADYVKYGSDYSFKEAERMLKDLEVIIYIQDFKITEISEIIGYDDENEKIIYRCIYKRNIESK